MVVGNLCLKNYSVNKMFLPEPDLQHFVPGSYVGTIHGVTVAASLWIQNV